jgi:tetratricopeptide (TPR) repeat protein
MEGAYDRIKGNKALACWTLSNLGDMYGHAGRVDKAYQNYLRVLSINPNDDYSLKGIAWIALSHDNKLGEAGEIINFLLKKKRMPEGHLMLAELATLSGNEKERIHQLRLFKATVDNPAYGSMYNKYVANVEADLGYPERCIAIAYEEIKNRPTPQSYDLLAWGYHKKGDHNKALQIVRAHVEDQTFEPESLYHMGMIYRANGFLEKGDEFLKEAGKSSFELGPSIAMSIENILR